MALLDWLIVAVIFLILGAIAFYSNRHVKGVADFLSANRCAGRFLLVGAELMALTSATLFVARGEQYYVGGFPFIWWGTCLILIGLIKTMSGWVLYRFRETRALTMAQFFERRYDKKFRIFMGILAWTTGILNYAIHPAVTSRLLVYFCGLPLTVNIFGVEVKTIILIMIIMLSIATFLTLSGGQISLMVTDFFQGQLLLIVSLIIVGFLFFKFDWSLVAETLQAAPVGKSLIDPFDQKDVKGFNIWFWVIITFMIFYQEMAFQGNQGYFCAAKNPHEAKMSRIIAMWRDVPLVLLYICVAMATYVIFNSSFYAADASSIQESLTNITDKWAQNQMRIPLTLSHILPVGLMGMLVSVLIASSISTDDTYLHAWGSIFIQDIVMPLRKKPLSPKQHLKWLRVSVLSVAVFAFIAASFIPVRDFVYMYFYITFAIYGAGAGAAIIGGLYWKKGTTLGAWCAVITGFILCGGGFVLQIIWEKIPALTAIKEEFPLNGLQMCFIGSLTSLIVYLVVSLLTNKKPFNMDKLLRRGEYKIDGEHRQVIEKVSFLRKLTGIGKEFTFKDKIFATLAIAWSLSLAAIVWGGNIYRIFSDISDSVWIKFWAGFLILFFVLGCVVFVWYFIGGIRDVIDLFRNLRSAERDDSDDGAVDDD